MHTFVCLPLNVQGLCSIASKSFQGVTFENLTLPFSGWLGASHQATFFNSDPPSAFYFAAAQRTAERLCIFAFGVQTWARSGRIRAGSDWPGRILGRKIGLLHIWLFFWVIFSVSVFFLWHPVRPWAGLVPDPETPWVEPLLM